MIILSHKCTAERGFTLLEVLISALLLGILVFTVQQTVARLLKLRQISSSDIILYRDADNLMKYIRSGKGVYEYLLTEQEKRKVDQNLGNKEDPRKISTEMNSIRFVRNVKQETFRGLLKLDGEKVHVIISREVIEPEPFLFGIEITVSRRKKTTALKGLLSWYDLHP